MTRMPIRSGLIVLSKRREEEECLKDHRENQLVI